MTVSYQLRQRVSQRAHGRCEYCLLSESASAKQHETDHIIPRKHGGTDHDDNLAWTCFHCNRYKGSEVGAYDQITGELTPLFNPRTQAWGEHFAWVDGEIIPQTDIGRVKVLVLELNRPLRVEVRRMLALSGRYS